MNNLKIAFQIFSSSYFIIIYAAFLIISFILTIIYAIKNPDVNIKKLMKKLSLTYIYAYLIIVSLAVLLGVCLAFIDLLPKLLPTK